MLIVEYREFVSKYVAMLDACVYCPSSALSRTISIQSTNNAMPGPGRGRNATLADPMAPLSQQSRGPPRSHMFLDKKSVAPKKKENTHQVTKTVELAHHSEDRLELLRKWRLKVSDIENPIEVIKRICAQDDLREELRERFSYQGRVLLTPEDLENRGETQLAKQLASELNVAITGSVFSLASNQRESSIKSNRVLLNERVPQLAGSIDERNEGKDESAINVLDVLLDEELRAVSYTHLTLPTKRIV